MITTRHMSTEIELVRWMLLAAAAVALILAIATAIASADPAREPRLLPQNILQLAKPMPAEVQQPFFPEEPPIRKLPAAEATARLWAILDSHRSGSVEDALAEWNQVLLPAETAHWREIAIGAAYLRVGDHERAAIHLDTARNLVPDHAIVAYFTGLLRLQQASGAGRVPDIPRGRHDLFVVYTAAEDKESYQTLAIAELRFAIARAADVRPDEPLMATRATVDEEIIAPTAGDLLIALGADNFVGNAHGALFGLQLHRGDLADAEFHIEQASIAGLVPQRGYQDLATAYLDQGQNSDALRVIANRLETELAWVRPLRQWLHGIAADTAKAIWVW